MSIRGARDFDRSVESEARSRISRLRAGEINHWSHLYAQIR